MWSLGVVVAAVLGYGVGLVQGYNEGRRLTSRDRVERIRAETLADPRSNVRTVTGQVVE